MTAEQPKKDRPKAKPIEGLTLLDPAQLAGDFRRFRNDDLYFISTCLFHPPGGKPIPRIIAMTPVAFFVTDPAGKMDRASRFESITEGFEQTVQTKSLFGGTSRRNILLRVPKEVDCLVSFDLMNLVEQDKSILFFQVLKKIVEDKTKRTFNITEVDSTKDIALIRNDTAATGYMSPDDILRQNKDRKVMEEKVIQSTNEALELKSQITQLTKCIEVKSRELKELESVVGVDLSVLRKEKTSLQQRQVAAHKKLTLDGIELVKQEADCTRLREQLDEERQNYDKLVKQKLTSAGTSASQQQNEMMQLRQKAQLREIAKATTKLTTLKAALNVVPTYTGPEALVANARDLEQKVSEAIDKWERDMESSNKIDKFLDALNAEISRISYHIADKNQTKQQLMQARAEKQSKMTAGKAGSKLQPSQRAAAAPHAEQAGGLTDFLDDDLLGGEPMRRVPSDSNMAEAPRSIRQDDDIFGDAGTSPVGGGGGGGGGGGDGGGLDDLLDGPLPPSKAAAVDTDLF